MVFPLVPVALLGGAAVGGAFAGAKLQEWFGGGKKETVAPINANSLFPAESGTSLIRTGHTYSPQDHSVALEPYAYYAPVQTYAPQISQQYGYSLQIDSPGAKSGIKQDSTQRQDWEITPVDIPSFGGAAAPEQSGGSLISGNLLMGIGLIVAAIFIVPPLIEKM